MKTKFRIKGDKSQETYTYLGILPTNHPTIFTIVGYEGTKRNPVKFNSNRVEFID